MSEEPLPPSVRQALEDQQKHVEELRRMLRSVEDAHGPEHLRALEKLREAEQILQEQLRRVEWARASQDVLQGSRGEIVPQKRVWDESEHETPLPSEPEAPAAPAARTDSADAQPEAEAPRKATWTWQEAAECLERLRQQGEPYTSHEKLAKQLGCPKTTVHKAIKKTASLQAWARRQPKDPKAQSLNPVVSDNTAQTREPEPVPRSQHPKESPRGT
jgi:hypothetical protein